MALKKIVVVTALFSTMAGAVQASESLLRESSFESVTNTASVAASGELETALYVMKDGSWTVVADKAKEPYGECFGCVHGPTFRLTRLGNGANGIEPSFEALYRVKFSGSDHKSISMTIFSGSRKADKSGDPVPTGLTTEQLSVPIILDHNMEFIFTAEESESQGKVFEAETYKRVIKLHLFK